MDRLQILKELRKWRCNWRLHLDLCEGSDHPFDLGATTIKGFTLKRLNNLIKRIENE